MKFCPQCGITLESGSRFCQECGFDTTVADTILPEELKPLMPENLRSGSPGDAPAEVQSNDPVTATEAKLFCPNCGVSMEPGDVFCQECGYNTAVTQPPVAETIPAHPIVVEELNPEPTPENTPPGTDSTRQFCPECGAAMEPEDVFCPECGHGTLGQPEVPAATVIQPVIDDQVITATPLQIKKEPQVFETQLPPPPAVKPPDTAQTAAQVNQAGSHSPGKKKGLLVILLAILAIAVIGAGGWFAFDKLIKNPAAPAIDTTAIAAQQEPVPVAEPEIVENSDISEEPADELPAAEPQKEVQKPAQNKQATTNKTTPKKQAIEPGKPEPQAQEPVQNTEPLKVKMKTTGSKTGRTILSIYNNNEVKSGPLFASKLKLGQAFIITKITTYHHNWGKGSQPGTISLQKKKETFGPWQASGAAGDDGTPNGKWVCEPNVRLSEGTYKIEVSDEKSWSYNRQSDQKGFVVVEGYEAD